MLFRGLTFKLQLYFSSHGIYAHPLKTWHIDNKVHGIGARKPMIIWRFTSNYRKNIII
jgi:hypothetical protein